MIQVCFRMPRNFVNVSMEQVPQKGERVNIDGHEYDVQIVVWKPTRTDLGHIGNHAATVYLM
jgi:hypothetical protein